MEPAGLQHSAGFFILETDSFHVLARSGLAAPGFFDGEHVTWRDRGTLPRSGPILRELVIGAAILLAAAAIGVVIALVARLLRMALSS